MADKPRSLRITKLETHVFGAVSAEQAWTPPINVYDCGQALHVCVELAGVRREAITVSVEPGRLIIEGRREVPEPEDKTTLCIREMEIDHGLFRRVLVLPERVAIDKVQSSYREGLLWIVLPVK